MGKKRFYLAGSLIVGFILLGSWVGLGAPKSLKELEAEIQALKEENLKLKKQIEELNAKLELLLIRIEKLEQANQGSGKSSDQFEETPISGKGIPPGNNLPVIKVEAKPEGKVIEIIDEDKKNKAKSEPKRDVVLEAKKLIEAKKYGEAEKLIKDRLSEKPEPKEACSLFYYLGQAQAGLGKDSEAAKTYVDLSDKYPACDYAPEAMFKAGELYEKLGNQAQARKLYQDLVSLYPFSKYANLAEEKLKK